MTAGRHEYREMGWGRCAEVVSAGAGLRYCEGLPEDAIHDEDGPEPVGLSDEEAYPYAAGTTRD